MLAAPPLQPPQVDSAADRCVFEHPLFGKLGDVAFRLAESDGTPCLILPLGRSSAMLPLRSLQAELRIDGTSADGRMLVQVARSLDFVTGLRLGDPLPAEVLNGTASWQPSARHRQLAASRLKLQLIGQLETDTAVNWMVAEASAVLAAAAEPGMRLGLQAALIEAAARLGFPDAAAVARLMEDAAEELAFVEALRDSLLRRVLRLNERVRSMTTGLAQTLSRLELLSCVLRLTSVALDRTQARFTDVEARTEVVLDVLRASDAWRALVRQHRDWLHCSLRGWEPVLAAWEIGQFGRSDGAWALLSRTYRFLALRYMPMQEWQAAVPVKPHSNSLGPRIIW